MGRIRKHASRGRVTERQGSQVTSKYSLYSIYVLESTIRGYCVQTNDRWLSCMRDGGANLCNRPVSLAVHHALLQQGCTLGMSVKSPYNTASQTSIFGGVFPRDLG